MQLTLSLTPRTHLFVKDGKVFFKLHKMSQFSDRRDYSVVNAITLEQAEKAYEWLGQVIAEHKQQADGR